MDSDIDSDFYGSETIITRLKSRVSSFSPSHYRSTHPHPNLITLRLTPSSSYLSSSPPDPSKLSTRLHNRFAHLPSCAWQLTESLDAFLARLPPATTDRTLDRPWIYIANPYIPPEPASHPQSLSHFIKGGTERLALLEEFITQVNEKTKSPFAAKREIAKARKEAISDLRELAEVTNQVSGKWMLFPEPGSVNEVWATIVKATANNELGIGAKVETRVRSDKERLICIYTADFRDKDDVTRVLRRLKELELVRPGGRQIYYKCDAWTELNIYGGNKWEIPASMYSSNEIFAYLKEQATKRL